MYPLTFYVDSLPSGVAGQARGPLIFIQSTHRQDVGIYRHELEHVRQFFRLPILHSFLYLLSKKYKLWAEVEAYREQMRWPDGKGGALSAALAAKFIATRYGLDISIDDAQAKLERQN